MNERDEKMIVRNNFLYMLVARSVRDKIMNLIDKIQQPRIMWTQRAGADVNRELFQKTKYVDFIYPIKEQPHAHTNPSKK